MPPETSALLSSDSDMNLADRDGPTFSGAPAFTNFTFAKAPNLTSLLAKTPETDSYFTPSTSTTASPDFRRSNKQRQSLHTPRSSLPTESKPHPFLLTPQSPEKPTLRHAFPASASFSVSQNAVAGKSDMPVDELSMHSFQRDDEASHLSPDPEPSSPQDVFRQSTSLIQERIARMKTQRRAINDQGTTTSLTRPFARVTRKVVEEGSQDVFSSKGLPMGALPLLSTEKPMLSDSYPSSQRSSLPGSLLKTENYPRHQQSTPDPPNYPPVRSKSVLGGRSTSIESTSNRALPAMLVEALASAENWGAENQAMVRTCANLDLPTMLPSCQTLTGRSLEN